MEDIIIKYIKIQMDFTKDRIVNEIKRYNSTNPNTRNKIFESIVIKYAKYPNELDTYINYLYNDRLKRTLDKIYKITGNVIDYDLNIDNDMLVGSVKGEKGIAVIYTLKTSKKNLKMNKLIVRSAII